MADGQPRFVTAFGAADTQQGWRPQRFTGGIVIDVATNEIVVRNLNMPHSPRVHAGSLWVLNSGAGELLRIDFRNYKTEIVCCLPGYVRGLSFAGHYALVGLGVIRDQYRSLGLPVQARHRQLYCGVAVVDLRSGKPIGMFQFENGCEELYDIQFLPGVLRPMLAPVDHEAARLAVAGPNFAYWLKPAERIS